MQSDLHGSCVSFIRPRRQSSMTAPRYSASRLRQVDGHARIGDASGDDCPGDGEVVLNVRLIDFIDPTTIYG
jgi:hypothetical protein